MLAALSQLSNRICRKFDILVREQVTTAMRIRYNMIQCCVYTLRRVKKAGANRMWFGVKSSGVNENKCLHKCKRVFLMKFDIISLGTFVKLVIWYQTSNWSKQPLEFINVTVPHRVTETRFWIGQCSYTISHHSHCDVSRICHNNLFNVCHVVSLPTSQSGCRPVVRFIADSFFFRLHAAGISDSVVSFSVALRIIGICQRATKRWKR